MIAQVCQHERYKKHGTTKAGATRYRCRDCGKTWTESTELFEGMRIGLDRAAKIIELLCEGMSVSATARVTDTDPHTVIDLMTLVGQRCEAYMREEIHDVFTEEVQVDEIWSYVFCKSGTAKRKNYVGGCGDAYCFTAVDRHTKLVLAWHHGRRNEKHTMAFCRKLSQAIAGEFQLSTDGFGAYPAAVRWTMGGRVNYGMLVKIFGEADREDRRKYSPAKIIASRRQAVLGSPDEDRICTSHSERLNGSIRNFVKRMGRLTYCFSKRWANHRAALGLFFAFYNYCRTHKTLKGMTPAMAHGIATEVWSVRKLLENVAN